MQDHQRSQRIPEPPATSTPAHPAGRRKLYAALVRCYPLAWRERYGYELTDLLATESASPRLAFDLLRGALDAHRHPQYPVLRLSRLRRTVGLAVLALALLAGGYLAEHPPTPGTFDTLATTLRTPHSVATATPGEHGYSQRGGRPE